MKIIIIKSRWKLTLERPGSVRDGKRCEQCKRCSCKEFPTGVKFLVKNVIKGGVKKFSPKLYSKNVIKGCVKTPGNHKCL